MTVQPDFFRQQAKRLRAIAKRSHNKSSEELLGVAAEYDRLADELELKELSGGPS